MAVIPPNQAPAGANPTAAMAAANAKTAAAVAAQAQKGGKSGMILIVSLGLFAMLAIGLGSPSLLVFMIIALGPTIGAALADKDPEKHAAIAVGAMSLAAMIPLVLGQFTAKAGSGYHVLRDPFAWLSVYGAAGVGWAIHAVVPAVTLMLSDLRAEWRRKDLLKLQDDLQEEWGPEVATKKRATGPAGPPKPAGPSKPV